MGVKAFRRRVTRVSPLAGQNFYARVADVRSIRFGVETVSLKAGVDVVELLRKIEAEMCPLCQKKLATIAIPISQTLTVRELLAQEAHKK